MSLGADCSLIGRNFRGELALTMLKGVITCQEPLPVATSNTIPYHWLYVRVFAFGGVP